MSRNLGLAAGQCRRSGSRRAAHRRLPACQLNHFSLIQPCSNASRDLNVPVLVPMLTSPSFCFIPGSVCGDVGVNSVICVASGVPYQAGSSGSFAGLENWQQKPWPIERVRVAVTQKGLKMTGNGQPESANRCDWGSVKSVLLRGTPVPTQKICLSFACPLHGRPAGVVKAQRYCPVKKFPGNLVRCTEGADRGW